MKTLIAIFLLAAAAVQAQDDFEWLLAVPPAGGSTPPAPSNLTQMMSAYWRMDWTNAAASDGWGTNNLTPSGGPVAVTGLLTNAVKVIAASTQKVIAQKGPDLVVVSKSWAFAGWFRFYNNATAYIAGKYSANIDWALIRAATLSWRYATNGNSFITQDSGVAVTSNAWHLITAMVNTTNKEVILILDLASWTTNAVASIQASEHSLNLEIGCVSGNGNNMLGEIDNCGMWTNRTLSMAEITNLYAAGVGTNLVQNFRPSKFNGPMWTGGPRRSTFYDDDHAFFP